MKQTKTTLKELTAAYRAVLKHAAFAAMGLALSVGTANAYTTTSDVNFEGKYNNGALDVNTVPDGNTQFGYTYNGTDASGNSVAIATPTAGANIDPETSNFKYSDKDGVASDLGTTHVVGDYSDTSSTDSVVVFTNQSDIKADTAVNIANYTYVNGKGDTVQLGTTAQVFTENVTLSDGTEWVANGTAVLDPTTYAVTYTSSLTGNEVTYYLDSAGTGLIDSNGAAVTLDPGEINGAAKLSDVSSAYAADKALVTTANTNVDGWNSAEATNHATAIGAFNDDNTRQQELSGYWNTYTVAKDAYDSIVDSTNTESPKYAAQQQLEEAANAQADALAVYQTPIQQLIDEGAKEYADSLASNYDAAGSADALANGAVKDNAEAIATLNGDASTEGSVAYAVKQLEDGAVKDNAEAIADEATARADADTVLDGKITDEATARIAADNALQTNIDMSLAEAKAYTDVALQTAKDYTDRKVDSLEKHMSAGIASANALSAVAVSNVKKGEVSVGGGYGYYNSQSAMALGAAMGITDNWSVNAGAGFADSNISLRAGTNYKFKLF